MYILAHVGITLGATALVNGLVNGRQSAARETKIKKSISEKSPDPLKNPFSVFSWFDSLGQFMDIRLLILGSLLPDIIDKPVGDFLFSNEFHNGRIITHTLLISLIVLLAGILTFKNQRRHWTLALAIGMIAHLILDEMWKTPQTLFWPLYGWSFPRGDYENVISLWWSILWQEPFVFITECIGLIIIISFVYTLAKQKRMASFLLGRNP